MNYRKHMITTFAAMLLVFCNLASAASDAPQDAEKQAKLEAEYRQALESVEQERVAADIAVRNAREQLETVSEKQHQAAAQSTAELAKQDAKLAKMHEELNRARQQLSESSREIARVNREVARKRSRSTSRKFVIHSSSQPVIGLVLGDDSDVGIEILGVSPDGPSERAGIKQGDVIIAMDGRVLAAVDESGNVKNGLSIIMEDIEANEPVVVSVERGSETIDLIVVPEVREPLAWHSVSRFSSAPSAPTAVGDVVRVERIVVPEINTEALNEQIEKIRIDIEGSRLVMEARRGDLEHSELDYEFEVHELSEMGNFALHDANVWFGMPMTKGLKLAEMDAELGEYFKTDRGVLVLKAMEDNDLQLKSGDVILQVGDTEVNSPAEFMRALREFDSGQELNIDIKRERKNKSLKTTMPDERTSFFAPQVNTNYRVLVTTNTD